MTGPVGRAQGCRPPFKASIMQEQLLHYVWRTGRFDQQRLATTTGQSVQVLRRGVYHGHAGPDFSGAHIRVGDTVWHGHVEMHIYASEWYRHRHHLDPAYDGTILHVVWEEDQAVFRQDGTRLPCVELRKRVDHRLLTRYERLVHDGNGIPCKYALHQVSDIVRKSMLDRVLVERLDRKADAILATLGQQKEDWEETVWQHLAAGFGIPSNQEPLAQVARSLPLRFLKKYAHDPLSVEALLFGQAGMLEEDFQEEYPLKLQREYRFLRRKHELPDPPSLRWNFLRLRPVSFPTLRLARLASVAVRQENLLANVLMASTPQEWVHSLDAGVNPYWTRHYRFGVQTPASIKQLGDASSRSLVINVMAPLLFAYGRHRHESRYQEKALRFLEQIPAEQNRILDKWKPLPMPLKTAFDGQALLELQHRYCTPRRCLECAIGCQLIADIRRQEPTRVEDILANSLVPEWLAMMPKPEGPPPPIRSGNALRSLPTC